eukprot:934570-Rhodomonas_salina.1
MDGNRTRLGCQRGASVCNTQVLIRVRSGKCVRERQRERESENGKLCANLSSVLCSRSAKQNGEEFRQRAGTEGGRRQHKSTWY